MTAIHTDNAPAAIGPYVQGVNLGNMVITSGQLPINPETKQMAEGIEAQTIQSLTNALAIVNQAGLQIEHIVKTTVFVKDLNDFPVINLAYQNFFEERGAPYPARSCVEVARLPLDADIEIEVTAAK
ncbi:Rid family detoxifying hydrolase [Vibrio sp. SCSIO 43137]|uniref:Rid family detoxifying hydrolase n=1 Tax=Vibrio sp. SCSIO 43137 TaxID=3021011 RepID=UPI0023070962|nr:Rid family detoxifying hydrolase [Vibrio sp. SCSIO 43137]WCE28912.1 Rid family detoxifying hydrolase [Vibrio sp. SCSIO 43137]